MYKIIPLILLLSGCSYFGGPSYKGYNDPPDAVVITRQPEVYTRAEIDAINAETNCRILARSMLEAQRCGVRR